ncbi:hypothetical protein [Helicobacter sp. UBA3407]|nr:hypothetical protein [Helicobacter sp. UBA3407]
MTRKFLSLALANVWTGVEGYGGHSYDSVNLQETTQHNYHLKEWI